jgi:hypothetical protein
LLLKKKIENFNISENNIISVVGVAKVGSRVVEI